MQCVMQILARNKKVSKYLREDTEFQHTGTIIVWLIIIIIIIIIPGTMFMVLSSS